MRRVLEGVGVVAVYAIGAVCVGAMALGFWHEWSADTWKLLAAAPIIAVFVWGAFEHYSDRG